jgi:hypothetical protein
MRYECTNNDGSPFINLWKVFVDSQQADTTKEETTIYEMLYQLYWLTKEEIHLVEEVNGK